MSNLNKWSTPTLIFNMDESFPALKNCPLWKRYMLWVQSLEDIDAAEQQGLTWSVINSAVTVQSSKTCHIQHTPFWLPFYGQNFVCSCRLIFFPVFVDHFMMDKNLSYPQYFYILNKDKCTMDQELPDAAAYAPGRCLMCTHQMSALFCMKWRHGRRLESLMSNQKSDSINQCIFSWRMILSNFIPIWFEMMEP